MPGLENSDHVFLSITIVIYLKILVSIKGGVSHLTIKARGIDRGIQQIAICCVIFVICLLKITASIW